MARDWRDLVPPRASVWPILSCALTVWLAWQHWIVRPRYQAALATAIALHLERDLSCTLRTTPLTLARP